MKPYQRQLILNLLGYNTDVENNLAGFEVTMSAASRLDLVRQYLERGLFDDPNWEQYYEHGNGD